MEFGRFKLDLWAGEYLRYDEYLIQHKYVRFMLRYGLYSYYTYFFFDTEVPKPGYSEGNVISLFWNDLSNFCRGQVW